jgi:hypothetical protein
VASGFNRKIKRLSLQVTAEELAGHREHAAAIFPP